MAARLEPDQRQPNVAWPNLTRSVRECDLRRLSMERSAAPPGEHPVPSWLGESRDFWVKYAGGADPEVVAYCEKLRARARKGPRVSEVVAAGPPPRRRGGAQAASSIHRRRVVACVLTALVPLLAPGWMTARPPRMRRGFSM